MKVFMHRVSAMNEGAVGAPAERVLDLFHGVRLTPTQRRIAHCLVQHAPAVAYLSAAEVAELAGVSQPSVTRFAVALGHDGYPALRRRLRDLDRRRRRADRRTPATNSSRRYAPRWATWTGWPAQLADRDRIAETGRLLAESRPLPVLGLRAAAPLAAYFAYFAAKVHPDVRVLDDGGSLLTDRLEQAAEAGRVRRAGLRAAPLPPGDPGRAARRPRRRADRGGDHRLAGQPGHRARRRGARPPRSARSSSSTCTPPR